MNMWKIKNKNEWGIMIKGLGVDIVENKRFTNMKDSTTFIDRYFESQRALLSLDTIDSMM